MSTCFGTQGLFLTTGEYPSTLSDPTYQKGTPLYGLWANFFMKKRRKCQVTGQSEEGERGWKPSLSEGEEVGVMDRLISNKCMYFINLCFINTCSE